MGRKEDITARIQASAIEEFIQKGLDSGSMESIAKNADVSKRTLYKYYPNKDAIFDDIIQMLLESFKTYAKFPYDKNMSIEEQLDNILHAKIELVTSEEYIKISKLVLSEILKDKKLSEDHLNQFYESEQHFINWIQQAKNDGKVISDQAADLIANQFHSILKGQIFYPVIFGIAELSKDDLDKSKQITKEFFLNSFCQ